MEEAALNLGARGWRLFARIVFPLAMPGYLAGAALVFIKVFDDLGTPLVLGQTNLLAPQAYLRITQVGLEDPLGYVISVIMIAFSILALWLSVRVMKGKDYSTLQKGGAGIARRRLKPAEALIAYAVIVLVLLVVLSPHLGLLVLSFTRIWSYSVLPETWTLANYATVFEDSSGMITNTLLYCGLAAGIDVVIGTAIAYLILRTRIPGRQWLDFAASAAIAVPGIVLAIGYLRMFQGVEIGGVPVTQTWLLIMLAYSVRRLPYALRSCMAALQQINVNLEEAAEMLGASKWRAVRRIVIPLMAGGILAGFVSSFITAAVELSATILLVVKESQAPMSYGIYLYMQSVSGRGAGAALGVLLVLTVAIGTYLSHILVDGQPQPG
jgi:iron(III) transport system permease protein